MRPDDTSVPLGPERLVLLDEARELVTSGKSQTLYGGVRYLVKKAYNEARRKASAAAPPIPASVRGGDPSDLDRIRQESIARFHRQAAQGTRRDFRIEGDEPPTDRHPTPSSPWTGRRVLDEQEHSPQPLGGSGNE